MSARTTIDRLLESPEYLGNEQTAKRFEFHGHDDPAVVWMKEPNVVNLKKHNIRWPKFKRLIQGFRYVLYDSDVHHTELLSALHGFINHVMKPGDQLVKVLVGGSHDVAVFLLLSPEEQVAFDRIITGLERDRVTRAIGESPEATTAKQVIESPEFRVTPFSDNWSNLHKADFQMADNMEVIKAQCSWDKVKPLIQGLDYTVHRIGYSYGTTSPASTERAVLRRVMDMSKQGKFTGETDVVAVEFKAQCLEDSPYPIVYFILQPGQREILDRAIIQGSRETVGKAIDGQ